MIAKMYVCTVQITVEPRALNIQYNKLLYELVVIFVNSEWSVCKF
jgi:hypothetical protein